MQPCNVTLFGQIEVENHDMCGYVNYHVVMLILFGFVSFYCMTRACLEYVIFTSSQENASRSLLWGVICLVLSTGFEGVYILSFLFFACICLQTPAQACLDALCKLARHILKSAMTAVRWIGFIAAHVMSRRHAQVEPGPIAPTPATLDEIVVLDGVVVMENIKNGWECPICIDSGGENEKWFTPACGHAFHFECIKNWMSRGTCPLCRGPLFFQ